MTEPVVLNPDQVSRIVEAARSRLKAAMPHATVDRMLAQSSDMPCSITRSDDTIVYANEMYLEMCELKLEDLIGKTHRVVKSGYQSAVVYDHINAVLSDGGTWWGEFCNRTPHESLKWVEAFIAPVEDESLIFFAALYRDNMAGHRTDSPLQLHDLVLEPMAESVLIADAHDQDLPIIYVNEAWTRLTGYRLEETMGRNCRFLQGNGTDESTINELRRCLKQAEIFRGEVLNYRKEGTPFWNELEIRPVRGGDGELTHFVGTSNDVTERRHFRAQSEFEENILKRLARGQPLDDVLRDIALSVEEQFSPLSTSIFLVDKDDGVLVARCAPNLPESFFKLVC
ncbi:MAG: PAS domain-containing protein [Candidatus Synoicihabitans palmerolidicus]|nr:PAS domain-containing protein [Candidatus Synoicihabitans palmerolidicus]